MVVKHLRLALPPLLALCTYFTFYLADGKRAGEEETELKVRGEQSGETGRGPVATILQVEFLL